MSDLDKDNYRNNVDKSILVVKDIRNSLKPTSVGYISIENVLKELETYKKIAEKLAEELGEKCSEVRRSFMGKTVEDIWGCNKYDNCKDCYLDWARNEVENEIQKSN